jgi:aquaporin related protein
MLGHSFVFQGVFSVSLRLTHTTSTVKLIYMCSADPAVTVGMYLIGAIDFIRAALLFVTQIIAAIAAAAIVSGLFTGGLNVSTTLSTTTTVAQGTIIEMLLTMSLVFTIFMLAAEKHSGHFIAPVGIGLSLFVAKLTGESIRSTLKV